MAELVKSFVTLDKDSGSGNGIVTASANSQNTGRSVRFVDVTFSAANCEDKVRRLNQQGKPESVSIQSAAAPTSAGGTLTLQGISNSPALAFTKGTDNIGLTLPSTYTAAGLTVNNGEAITGDPGASQEYAFSIQMQVPANTTIEPKTCQIIVTDDGGHTSTCLITLAAGEAYLTVGQPSGDLPWDGSTPVTIQVESNTTWTVE